jgi:hypothetical protein
MLIAAFVSGHGFGHAARMCAVIDAIGRLKPDWRFMICSEIPRSFFAESISFNFEYRSIVCDIGFVQETPLIVDYEETIAKLDAFFPISQETIRLAEAKLDSRRPDAILCDIAPLGLLLAQALSVPSVLIENFLWSDLYRAVVDKNPSFEHFAGILDEYVAIADLHIAAEPALRLPEGRRVSQVLPISRCWKTEESEVRRRLGASPEKKIVFFSGRAWDAGLIKRVSEVVKHQCIMSGGGSSLLEFKGGRAVELGDDWYHPDIMNTADSVFGKLGYSTLAEAYSSGVPFAFVARSNCRESDVLRKFALENLCSREVSRDASVEELSQAIERLTACPKTCRKASNGADVAAKLIVKCVDGMEVDE